MPNPIPSSVALVSATAGTSRARRGCVDSGRAPMSILTSRALVRDPCPGQRSSIGGSPSSQFHSLSSMNWATNRPALAA